MESSAGKTFSFTGWKVGWALGAPRLAQAIRAAHQFVTFCTATPFQHAMAAALQDEGQVILLLNRRGFSTHIQVSTKYAATKKAADRRS